MPSLKGLAVSNDPYRDIADLYDIEHDEFDLDIQMYLQFVKTVGDPVLELACGTGRILSAVAGAGFRVTGADASEAMLARAQARIAAAGHQHLVSLQRADIVDAAQLPGGPFGVVIIALDGLLHLTRQSDQLSALQSARQALDPRGLLLLDVFHASPRRLTEIEQGVRHDGTWSIDVGTRVDKFSARTIAPAEQHLSTSLWYDQIERGGAVRRTATSFTQRYITPGEMSLLLTAAGFPEWQVYGDYELSPFDDESDRLIVAAEVTPAS